MGEKMVQPNIFERKLCGQLSKNHRIQKAKTVKRNCLLRFVQSSKLFFKIEAECREDHAIIIDKLWISAVSS